MVYELDKWLTKRHKNISLKDLHYYMPMNGKITIETELQLLCYSLELVEKYITRNNLQISFINKNQKHLLFSLTEKISIWLENRKLTNTKIKLHTLFNRTMQNKKYKNTLITLKLSGRIDKLPRLLRQQETGKK